MERWVFGGGCLVGKFEEVKHCVYKYIDWSVSRSGFL